MSLMRTAIVLSLCIAIMPSDRAQQQRLYENAAVAAHWTSTFCDRNPGTCANAAGLWDTFVRKAQFAGALVYDIAVRSAHGPSDAAAPVALDADRGAGVMRGTLTPDDLGPAWRGTRTHQGI